MDVQFNHPDALLWFWVIAALVILVIASFHARRRAMQRIGDAPLVDVLLRTVSATRRRIRAVIVLIAAFLIVIAMLDPRMGTRYREVQQHGIDVFFALDVSRSMLARDVRPDRLERAKQYIQDTIEVMGSDRVGLITFAGDPVVSVPLTFDYGAMQLALREIDPKSAMRGGSMIGDAIRLATESYTDDVDDHKVIILLTDGGDMGSYPAEAAAEAAARGIKIFPVGLGDDREGARIPITVDGQEIFLTHDGQEVWSVMDAQTLRQIAQAAGGVMIPAGVDHIDLGEVYQALVAPAAGRTLDTATLEEHIPRFQYPAVLALILLIADAVMTNQRSKKTPEALA
jgi:Ca-activated chloride channel family protein